VAREYGGTGLGSDHRSRLVGMIGGRIWVESAPGTGSIFHFTRCCGMPRNRPLSPERSPTEAVRRKFHSR